MTCFVPSALVIIPSGPGSDTPGGACTAPVSGGHVDAQLPVHVEVPLPGLSWLKKYRVYPPALARIVPALVCVVFSATMTALDEGSAAAWLAGGVPYAVPAPDGPDELVPQAAAAKATAVSPPAAHHRLRILALLHVREIGFTHNHTDPRHATRFARRRSRNQPVRISGNPAIGKENHMPIAITSATHTVTVDDIGPVQVTITERGAGRPDSFRIDPSAMPAEQQAVMAGNRTTLAVYGGASMSDPGLAPRLPGIAVPALVLWGDSDQIAGPGYGRAYAAAIPGARFQLLPDTGHVPQIETPGQLLRAIWDFADPHTRHPIN